jgi:hypothetical protein
MDEHDHIDPLLSPEDTAAVDAVVESGGSLPAGPGATSDRARAVARLLATLEVPAEAEDTSHRELLVNVTYARVLRDRDEAAAGRISPVETTGPTLSDADIAAIDQLEASEWRGTDERSVAASQLLSLLGAPDSGASPTLVESTLERVRADVDAQRMRFRLDPAEEQDLAQRRRTFRLTDFGAIAAILLIGFGILMPVLDGMRAETRIAVNAGRMAQAGLGMGLFAADHDDRLPAAHDAGLSGRWWEVGNADESHSAHLYSLARLGYVGIESLASPGNVFAPTRIVDPQARDWRSSRELSYSYRIFDGAAPRIGVQQPSIVMSDRSPLVQRLSRGESADPMERSPNHGGRGQHVLVSDGRVRFLEQPVIGNDLLWLPKAAEVQGSGIWRRQAPAGPGDAFLGP